MVLPMVMGVLFFAVYLLLFQYNRCLLEQDAAALAMWGSTLRGEEEEIVSEIEMRIESIYREKYLVWEMTEFNARIKNNVFTVLAGGEVKFPLPGWNFWNDENVWETQSEWSYQRLQPVEFVRMCNKLRESKGE